MHTIVVSGYVTGIEDVSGANGGTVAEIRIFDPSTSPAPFSGSLPQPSIRVQVHDELAGPVTRRWKVTGALTFIEPLLDTGNPEQVAASPQTGNAIPQPMTINGPVEQ